MGFISDIVGGFTGLAQQSQANAAAQQDTSALNKLYGQEGGIIDNIAQQYYGQGGGASMLNGLEQFAGGNLGQTYASPYTQAASGTAGGLAAGGQGATNPYAGAAGGAASQLQNFNGLKPQELAALQQSIGAGGQSTINSARQQLGGSANPNALIQSLMGQNQQNALSAGVQLGGQAAGQELAGQQSAAGIFSGLSGQNIGAQEAGGQLQSGLSGQNLSYMDSMIQALLGSTGQQSGLLGEGLSGINQMANTYGNAAGNAANLARQDGQGAMSSFGQGLNGIGGLFTGGAAGAGGIGSLFG